MINRNNLIVFVPVIIIVILFSLHLAACQTYAKKDYPQVCFRKNCVDVEIVQKQADVQRGLQFRKSLGADAGMLFIFPESRSYSFWMKDTLIPLDMIWMDHARRIVHIAPNVPPCAGDPCPTYTPQQKALYVLETNAGYVQKYAIKEGDTARFLLF